MCLRGQVKLVWTLQWCQCIKNVWSEHLTLLYCCCRVVITQRYQVWDPRTEEAIERENKVGEIANQLKINSWELLAFIALFPFPPPVSPHLSPPGQNIFSISDTRTLHNWLVNSVFVRIVRLQLKHNTGGIRHIALYFSTAVCFS